MTGYGPPDDSSEGPTGPIDFGEQGREQQAPRTPWSQTLGAGRDRGDRDRPDRFRHRRAVRWRGRAPHNHAVVDNHNHAVADDHDHDHHHNHNHAVVDNHDSLTGRSGTDHRAAE